MTWTTGKITCFALAVLELPQELGRREAADWKPQRGRQGRGLEDQKLKPFPMLGVPSGPSFLASLRWFLPL